MTDPSYSPPTTPSPPHPSPPRQVLYGDSNIAYYSSQRTAWFSAFPTAAYKTQMLGVSGSTVEYLAWRLTQGGEAPARAPKTVAFLIGLNDLYYNGGVAPSNLSSHMEWVVDWAKAKWPSSRLAVMALLPTSIGNVTGTNVAYAGIAKRAGALFVDCSSGMKLSDSALYQGECLLQRAAASRPCGLALHMHPFVPAPSPPHPTDHT